MGLVYPHIDIKDTEEASLLQLDATDNTVLVPVPFVQRFCRPSDDFSVLNPVWDPDEERDKIQAKLYTDANTFIKEWSIGGGEWKVTIDPLTNEIVSWDEPLSYSKGSEDNSTSPRYCFEYSIKLRSEKTPEGYPTYDVIYNYEKSYLMVIELLKRGLPVLVQPIPIKWTDFANVNDSSVMNADNAAGSYHIAESGLSHDVVYNKYEGIAIVEHNFLMEKVDKVINGTEEGQTEGLFDKLVDKNLYPIKFITSGCYPNIGNTFTDNSSKMYIKLTELAKLRGDAISILELKENILNKEELIDALNDSAVPFLDFELYKVAAAFTPWCEFSIDKILPTGRSAKCFNLTPLTTMPAGFAYLMAYAYSIQTNASWWAAAGVMRGQIPQMVKPLFEIGDSFMHLLQGMDSDQPENIVYTKMRLNPIMNTGSYGYRIWGNRMAAAFKDLAGVYKTMYSEFLNVRMLLCDIKKQIYAAAMRTTFEPNDDITWVSFKVLCSNLLDRMKSGRGLLWYKWHKEVSEERATIKAKLTVRPIEAVEHFDITVFLTDQDAEVEE